MKPPQIFIYIVSLLLVSFANGVSAQTSETTVTVSISYTGTPSLFESVPDDGFLFLGSNRLVHSLEDASIAFTVELSRALLAGERIDVPLNITGGPGFTLDDLTTPTIAINEASPGVSLMNINSLMPTVIFDGAGAQVANLKTTVKNDNILEEDETITFMLGSNEAFAAQTNTTLTSTVQRSPDASAFEVTLLDDEYTLCFDTNTYSVKDNRVRIPVKENQGTVKILVIRNRPINRDISVQAQELGVGTTDEFRPEIEVDYFPRDVEISNDLRIRRDVTEFDSIRYEIDNDRTQEHDEPFELAIAAYETIVSDRYRHNCDGRGESDREDGYSDIARITIVDTGATISIAADAPVSEGAAASFTISANGELVRDLTVDLRVSEPVGSDFVMDSEESTTHRVVIEAGQTMATLAIPTVDDDTRDAPQGSIIAEIISTVDNREIAAISTTSAEVIIYDNDIIASIESSRGAITEGGMASFIVSLDVAPTVPVEVNLRVSESGNFLDSEETTSVVIRAGQTMATLDISTDDDMDDEPEGSITVEIIDPTEIIEPTSQNIYKVGSTSASASVLIRDNDITVSIQSLDTEAIIEGDLASFTVSLAVPPTAPVEVNLSISESGNFLGLDSEETTSVVIAEGQTTATLVIRTVDDTDDEPAGVITVAIIDPMDANIYRVDSASADASIRITDNDIVASIESSGGAITEGSIASFTVRLDDIIRKEATVNLSVSESAGSNFVADDEVLDNVQTVTFDPGENEATFTVTTEDDDIDETNNFITVAIIDPMDANIYRVDSASGSASVLIYDNDNTASIEAIDEAIIEGNDASFAVRFDAAPTTSVTVNLRVSESGNFVDSEDPMDRSVVIEAGQTTATLVIRTVNDDNDEPHGAITVAIIASNIYSVDSALASDSVPIYNNDTTISIQSLSGTIVEGTPAEFRLNLSSTLLTPLTVNMDVLDAEGSDFVMNDIENTIQSVDIAGRANYGNAHYSYR